MRRIAALFTCLLLASGCGTSQEQTPPQATAIPVLAVAPEVRDVPVYVETVGTFRPSRLVEVRPQVNGTIAEVLVEEGGEVAAGTPLFKIDPVPYQIKLQEAAAKLEMDKAAYQAAQRKLDRFRSLADRDLISKTEWDELETTSEKAAAAVEADKASLLAAQRDLGNCTVAAPLEGRLGRIDICKGHLVSSGQGVPLVTVSDVDPLIVEFFLTEKEASQLPADARELEILSVLDSTLLGKGEITFLDNHFDPKTGLLIVRGKAANAERTMRPGQSIRVRVPVSVVADAKLIPQKAVKYNQEGPYIYVVGEDGIVAFRRVSLGKVQGKDIIILDGLSSDEKVITDGHLRIYPGSKVEVKS